LSNLERALKDVLFKAKSKVQLFIRELNYRVKSFSAITNFEDESTKSKKTFDLLSLMLLISFVFLSPDKNTENIPTYSSGYGNHRKTAGNRKK